MHVLQLSARIVDCGEASEPVNRVTQELSELADAVALVESFSHGVAVHTGDGLVVVDASEATTGAAVVEAVRRWSADPLHTLVYTRGHVDHVGGSAAFVADAATRAGRPLAVIAHRAVPERFARYRATDRFNLAVNARQFGWLSGAGGLGIGGTGPFLPADVAEPTVTYDRSLTLEVGGEPVELHHERGETDDHT